MISDFRDTYRLEFSRHIYLSVVKITYEINQEGYANPSLKLHIPKIRITQISYSFIFEFFQTIKLNEYYKIKVIS